MKIDPEDDEEDEDNELSIDHPLLFIFDEDGPDDYWGD
jgi:hypothetical protein